MEIPHAPNRKKPLRVPPAVGCTVLVLVILVIPALVLCWYPVKWRILLSRMESEDEAIALAAIEEMRPYPAKDVFPAFFRVWATTPSRSISQIIESDLNRGLSPSDPLGKDYLLGMVPEKEREAFAAQLSGIIGSGNEDQRRRALFSLYIVLNRGAEKELLAGLKDSSMAVRHVARLCLADIGDYEMLEHVLESLRIERPEVVSFTRVSVLGRGFRQVLPMLVTKLGAKASEDRQKAIDLLVILTGYNHGFKADAPPEERTAAMEKWKEYLLKQEEKNPTESGAEPRAEEPAPKAP